MESLPAVPDQATVSPEILNHFKYYEDYLTYFIQLNKATEDLYWVKADLLLHMADNIGDGSIASLARDIGMNYQTMLRYVRTARAFPQEKREPTLSISAHHKASYIDEYDQKTKKYKTNKRFKFVRDAADRGMSLDQVTETLSIKKLRDENPNGVLLETTEGQEAKQLLSQINAVASALRTRLIGGDAGVIYYIKKLHKTATEIQNSYEG